MASKRSRRRGKSTELTRFDRTPRRSPQPRRDDKATKTRGRSYRGVRGFTLIELLVAMAFLIIMVGTALPALPRNPYALWTAQAQILAEIRRTRNDALTRGDHFRLDITGPTTWVERRLVLVNGNWVVAGAPVHTGTLPDGIVFTTGVGSQFEFNTRGLMLNPGAAATLRLDDAANGQHRGVTVWPSGQVSPA